jgi:hypothetical protein
MLTLVVFMLTPDSLMQEVPQSNELMNHEARLMTLWSHEGMEMKVCTSLYCWIQLLFKVYWKEILSSLHVIFYYCLAITKIRVEERFAVSIWWISWMEKKPSDYGI